MLKLRFPLGFNNTQEGQWHEGRKWGRGKLVSSRGHVYDGTWRNGLIEGSGTLILPNFERFVRRWEPCTLREAVASVIHRWGRRHYALLNLHPTVFCSERSKHSSTPQGVGSRATRTHSSVLTLECPNVGAARFPTQVKVLAEREEKVRKARDEAWELGRGVRAIELAQYVEDVREYNIEMEEEKQRMAEAERIRLRDERREKVRKARMEAMNAAAEVSADGPGE